MGVRSICTKAKNSGMSTNPLRSASISLKVFLSSSTSSGGMPMNSMAAFAIFCSRPASSADFLAA